LEFCYNAVHTALYVVREYLNIKGVVYLPDGRKNESFVWILSRYYTEVGYSAQITQITKCDQQCNDWIITSLWNRLKTYIFRRCYDIVWLRPTFLWHGCHVPSVKWSLQ